MTDMIREYKDKYTLDGRLQPSSRVTKAKLVAAKNLFEMARHGDRMAEARMHESHSTTDAPFSFAYLTTINALQQYDRLPQTWSLIAGTRSLPDFRPAILTGIFGEFEGLERQGSLDDNNNPAGIAPVVPELSPYPYATISDVEASYGRLKKRGFKVGLSWEARVNDIVGFYTNLPNDMAQVARDTEEFEVYDGLINGTTATSQLDGGTTYTGATVAPNAPLSRDAVVQAIFELGQREINGRRIVVNGGYNLIVPIGAGPSANFMLNQRIIEATDGSFTLAVNDAVNQLGSVSIIESEYVTGTNWYLLPKPGTTRRPVLELGRLRGQEAPELRVQNLTGDYAGGGRVSPFEGSFDNDAIDYRLRYPITGLNWFPVFIVWSTGTGTA